MPFGFYLFRVFRGFGCCRVGVLGFRVVGASYPRRPEAKKGLG